jgi:hypothetical protein
MPLQNDPCGSVIATDLLKNCDAPPTAGIEQNIVLINVEDVDSITADVTLTNSLITDIVLAAGATGYKVQGVKQVFNYTNTLDAPDTAQNGVIHSLAIRILDPSAEARAEINKLIQGALLHAVVERKNKGEDNEDAFLLFGEARGLVLTDMTDDANENDGSILLTLSTPAGLREPFLPKVLLDTDYATTKTAFDNLFAAAGV